MFFFKRKVSKTPDLSWLGADMHAHLLPGIDDGAQNSDSSIALIKGLAELGYKKLIATPHVLWEVYPNTPEIINEKLVQLRQDVQTAGMSVKIDAAAEYFIDDYFAEQLYLKTPLLPLKDNLVLVEFSMMGAPFELQQIFFDMQVQGYQPVLAHPERYAYLTRRKEVFDNLKNAGCFFQLNLLSLTTHYGTTVQSLAHYLLEKGYYNFAGTDLHHQRQLPLLQKLAASDMVEQLKDYPFFNSTLTTDEQD